MDTPHIRLCPSRIAGALILIVSIASFPKITDASRNHPTACDTAAVKATFNNSLLLSPAPPYWIAQVYREAEENWRNDLPWWKKIAENYQDDIARDYPLLAYALDVTVGRYNMRPSAAREAITWATEQGITAQPGFSPMETVKSLIDSCSDTAIALVIIAKLKDQHPTLRHLNWSEIESSDQYVAKLYSGYSGAGGDWAAWRADTKPGSVTMQRLGYNTERDSYSLVRKYRPCRHREIISCTAPSILI
jgi:hypothetical protein